MKDTLTIEEREDLELELLLEAIYSVSGFDFRKYMRSSIKRRVENRMRLDHIRRISGMIEMVLYEKGYVEKLLKDFSINVTEMFRDPEFFKAFRLNIVPLLKKLPEIRIWHAGCSTGEEAFSMAIILKEEGLYDKARIYATDMNDEVLRHAEKGILPLNRMQSYTKNYLQAGGNQEFSEYYTTDYQNAYLDSNLLKNIVFFQHNLVTDGSFNEFHIIMCRNVMIYFTGELQTYVNQLFYDSLCKGGFLAVGSKETLHTSSFSEDYEDFDSKERIYRKL
ncbi:CheR family methyltransferase [Peribacillus simplex]|uniref:Chemotaxis protein CheR n=2 Tax=Peribacillus simplex TaxID=1478 RepID=A0A223EGL8_9BACI|nr:protein-glutamate O-methyltransferase CheR [Peribacillus simplex]ASS94387.1 chemotaxis protein CheR [Peribacillus simplex NBRC 15720 = DSM 1321]MEC1396566.1 protein-glutamate O-methyltransferase CheR [Peribacillus simplex]MED3911314.1 protein-glutamate O-methyltransferase CheR [Peribacillus simplex]TVX76364.1 protein-glutamate O-methyltransferase CheR [Peribacillus simplex]